MSYRRTLAATLVTGILLAGCGDPGGSKFDEAAQQLAFGDEPVFGFAPPDAEPNVVTHLATIPIDDANGIFALVDGTVVVTDGPALAAFDAATGTTRWSIDLDGEHHRAAGFEGRVAITAGDDGLTTLVDVETGNALWVTQTEGFAGSVALSDRFVVVANDEDQLVVLSAASGEILRTLEHPLGSSDAGFSIHGTDLAVGSAGLERASVDLFDLEAGTSHWFEEDGGLSIVPNVFVAPAFTDEAILYLTDGGAGYLVNLQDPYAGRTAGRLPLVGEPHVDAGGIAESFYVMTDETRIRRS